MSYKGRKLNQLEKFPEKTLLKRGKRLSSKNNPYSKLTSREEKVEVVNKDGIGNHPELQNEAVDDNQSLIQEHFVEPNQKMKLQFQCISCKKLFSYKKYLLKHERIHKSDSKCVCNLCGKNFNNQEYLRKHGKIHANGNSFECKYCNKKFNQKSYLKNHEKSHTDEKPYQCKLCDKAFFDLYKAKRHSLIHTGEKSFACDVCSRKFTQSNDLTKHKKNHTRSTNSIEKDVSKQEQNEPIEGENSKENLHDKNPNPEAMALFPIFPYLAQQKIIRNLNMCCILLIQIY